MNLKIGYVSSLCPFLWCCCHLGLSHPQPSVPHTIRVVQPPVRSDCNFLEPAVDWAQVRTPTVHCEVFFLSLCLWPQFSLVYYSSWLFADCQGMAVYCMDLVLFRTLTGFTTKIVIHFNLQLLCMYESQLKLLCLLRHAGLKTTFPFKVINNSYCFSWLIDLWSTSIIHVGSAIHCNKTSLTQ